MTDNGKEFPDRLFALRKCEATGKHEFDHLCTDLGIEPRPSTPKPTASLLVIASNHLPGNGSSDSIAGSKRCCNRTTSIPAAIWKPR